MRHYLKYVNLALFVLAAGAASAAPIVTTSPDPFSSPNFGFGITGSGSNIVCLSADVCSSDNISNNYHYLAGYPVFAADPNFGNQVSEFADMTATFSGLVYDSSHNLLGPYSVTADVDFEFVGRANNGEFGTFEAILTLDNLNVSAYGHTFGITLDPTKPTIGTLDIEYNPDQSIYDSNGVYTIDMTFPSTNTLLSVDPDNGGFAGVPFSYPLDGGDTSASVPEPATLTLFGLPLLAMWRARRKR